MLIAFGLMDWCDSTYHRFFRVIGDLVKGAVCACLKLAHAITERTLELKDSVEVYIHTKFDLLSLIAQLYRKPSSS